MAIQGKESENGLYEFPYFRKEQKSNWQTLKTTLYDPKNNTVLGRTGKSWAQILFFYCIFYTALAGLFAICMQGLFATLDDKKPTWLGAHGLIGDNPGLGFRPISSKVEEGSLIWYDSKNQTSIKKWKDLNDEFMKPYMESSAGKNNIIACNFEKRPDPNQACAVDTNDFGPCSPEFDYGLNTSSPCVFLKLNRIFGWVPEYYDNPAELPEDMPTELKEHIKALAGNQTERLKQVWVTCKGENPADRENINPNFGYYPYHGFPSYYYPYLNADGYLSPLVAVRIMNPTPNVLVNIECRAWAKNIKYSKAHQQREGSVHFELLRDA